METTLTVSLFVIAWMVFTLILLAFSVMNALTLQSVIDRLRLLNMKDWQEGSFKTMGDHLVENITWILLVLVIVAEIVAISFRGVRAWFLGHLLIGAIAFVTPILITVVIIIVMQYRKRKEEEKSQK